MSLAGWGGAGLSAAALLTGAAALALTVQRPAEPLLLELGQMPPAAPAIAAIADTAPQVVDEAPELDRPSELAPPDMPSRTLPDTPVQQVAASAMSLPRPDVPTASDLALPAQERPVKPVEPQKQARPEKVAKRPEPEPTKPVAKEKPRKPKETSAATKPAKKAAPPAASAGSSAPQQGQKAKGGAAKTSSAAYAKAVMKKVRATKKQHGAGQGAVIVGFTVAANGGLSQVKVIRSSGHAALDKIAIGHIQRSAPFPPPPEGMGRSFSFEFVGK